MKGVSWGADAPSGRATDPVAKEDLPGILPLGIHIEENSVSLCLCVCVCVCTFVFFQ